MKLKVDIPPRVESGPVCFEYNNGEVDWYGTFFRGDNAAGYAMDLTMLLAEIDETKIQNVFALNGVKGLLRMLEGSNENLHPELRQ